MNSITGGQLEFSNTPYIKHRNQNFERDEYPRSGGGGRWQQNFGGRSGGRTGGGRDNRSGGGTGRTDGRNNNRGNGGGNGNSNGNTRGGDTRNNGGRQEGRGGQFKKRY